MAAPNTTSKGVVPASAGVFPGSRSPTQGTPSRPRQRGGVPCVLSQVSVAMMSSPPARGCSHLDQRGRPDPHVVPASAGVFRGSPSAQPRRRGRPRQRGGVPARTRVLGDGAPSSPPARGCSGPGRRPAGHRAVVPASAGVFRCCGFWWRYVAGRPRQRGGVPAYTPGLDSQAESSPPARGCSVPCRWFASAWGVVPASAGVFRTSSVTRWPRLGRPRQRGGVPQGGAVMPVTQPSSPPARGCSGQHRPVVVRTGVVPASAGVFRSCSHRSTRRSRRPRQRGGVPTSLPTGRPSRSSSPPARGCSGLEHASTPGGGVVPASAGVFRT